MRYGAFGDMVQASSVFPALVDMGYSVVVNTTERGLDIVRNDPNVYAVLSQQTDQVPNAELREYWAELSKHFDLFINLSESVERSLLSVEGEKSFNWNKDFRHLVMSVDYLDAVHAISGCLDYPRRPQFFPNNKESSWAKKIRRSLGMANKVIMWPLSGSSVHKAWPHMDTFLARILMYRKDIKVVLTGDNLCQILEYPWENEKRVICKSGRWTIRETLSFMLECDLIMGPETGVLNAAAYEDMPKVLMLSHSSPENIGGNWINTITVTPQNTPCYPCHKLHYGFKTCNRDDVTGMAVCASNITPDEIYRHVVGAI